MKGALLIAIALALTEVASARVCQSEVVITSKSDGLEGEVRAFKSSHGWIVSDDHDKAEWAAYALAEAVTSFQRSFAVQVGRGVIAETRYVGFSDQLVEHETDWMLPWPTKSFAMDGRSAGTREVHHIDESSSLRHELGHAFFLAYVIPDRAKHQYGGDAPDWLDEAAAMAVETEKVAAIRRNQFHDQLCAGRLVPLDQFLVREHPIFAAPKMRAMVEKVTSQKRNKPVMVETTLTELDLTESSVADFYAQSRAVYDFLIARTGNERILGEIAADIEASGSAADWQDSDWFRAEAQLEDRSLAQDFDLWARGDADGEIDDCELSK